MEQRQAPLVANPAVRNGLVFGAILAGINIISTLIQWIGGSYQAVAQAGNGSGSTLGAATLFGCLAFLVGLALCFLAGMNTVSRTGRLGSGAIAGLITGLVGELVGGVLGLVLVLAFVLPTLHIPSDSTLTPGQIDAIIVGSAVVALIIGLIIDGGIGAGLGYLGGLVGKNNYTEPVQSYQESYYPPGGYSAAPPPPTPYYPTPPQPPYTPPAPSGPQAGPYPPAPQQPYSPQQSPLPQYPPQHVEPAPALPELRPSEPPTQESQPAQEAQEAREQPPDAPPVDGGAAAP
ncbi:MAG: hypothetical protein C5B60_12085 [Chloroflexi bacterium]|nr:MAG: hypothetical protein C5B60_12085 [Chloroflexota bacterium]